MGYKSYLLKETNAIPSPVARPSTSFYPYIKSASIKNNKIEFVYYFFV